MELTKEDIGVLLEALDSWSSEDQKTGLVSAILIGMVCNDKEQMEKRFNERMEKANSESKERDEIATMLKAKLLLMRNSIKQPAISSQESVSA